MSALLNADVSPIVAPWKVDAHRGTMSGRVSSEWFSRPDDQKFLSVNELYNHTLQIAQGSDVRTANVANLRVVAQGDKPNVPFRVLTKPAAAWILESRLPPTRNL